MVSAPGKGVSVLACPKCGRFTNQRFFIKPGASEWTCIWCSKKAALNAAFGKTSGNPKTHPSSLAEEKSTS